MQVFFFIAYLLIGLVQLFAIADGIGYALNIHGFFAFILAGIVTYIPILGGIAGVYGATAVWDWEVWQSLLLFFWFIPIGIIIGILKSFVR